MIFSDIKLLGGVNERFFYVARRSLNQKKVLNKMYHKKPNRKLFK